MSALSKFLWGSKKDNPAKKAMPYIEEAKKTTHQYYDPYVEQGQRVGGAYEGTAGEMAQNPQDYLNALMDSYQESPAFARQRDAALSAMSNSAAAGGMTGTPMDQQNSASLAASLASEDMQKWLDKVLGVQNTGMSAEQNIYNTGYNASSSAASDLSNLGGQQAQLAYQAQQAKNMQRANAMKGLATVLGGSKVGDLFGGGQQQQSGWK